MSLRRRRGLAALLAALIPLGMFATAGRATAAGPTSISFRGHGNGHGRGMGQYGAQGYAEAGDSYTTILSHFYGGTTMGSSSDANTIKVLLCSLEGVSVCTNGPGINNLLITSSAPFTFEGIKDAFPGGTLIKVTRDNPNNGWDVARADGQGCAGTSFSPVGQGFTGDSVVNFDPDTAPLQICAPSQRTYRGSIKFAMQGSWPRIVNWVGVGAYLQGVVPSEMPSSWKPEALKAQAVAARSYALSGDNRFPGFADTCDTTQCQAYLGESNEASSSNAAVAQTAGQVLMLNGAIARTEFSASTGGYSAGGTFPAVVDDGDATPDNPYHNWTQTVQATTIEQAYPSIGDFQAINITKRNGLGADGGRVQNADVVGSSGTVHTTGPDIQGKLGLKSDWFTPGIGFTRIAAADRYATAAAIATATFTSADTALVVRGDGTNSFPDGLAANYLGGVVSAPTLLATSDSVPQPTLDALKSLGVKTVHLVGGTGALSANVASTLSSAGYSVDRISGNDRYGTAAAIAQDAPATGIGTLASDRTAILSSGESFPDALASGGIVYANHYPQLLTAAGSLPSSTSSALTALGIKHVIITGGTGAVSTAVEQAVQALGITTERLAGSTRYETAVAIANASVDRLNFPGANIDVATGETFPDALTGGSHAGRNRAAIVLTTPGSVPSTTCGFLQNRASLIRAGTVLGGTGAVSDSALNALGGCA